MYCHGNNIDGHPIIKNFYFLFLNDFYLRVKTGTVKSFREKLFKEIKGVCI